MNVCILSKFPPLQGGISSRTYWLARAYAEAGISVHVVSNANIVEEIYRINGCCPHIEELPGITLHEVEGKLPWHIPDENHSLAQLLDKTLEVIEKFGADVIDAGYLVPYGIAGYLAHRITGVPYIVRHGGSDLVKFFKAGRFSRLLHETLEQASAIVTNSYSEEVFSAYADKLKVSAPYVPSPKFFYLPPNSNRDAPNLLYIGKINWHWERKGLDRIARCAMNLPPEWKMRWIAQGRGASRFIEHFDNISRESLEPFIPPWAVPQTLRNADYVFCLSVNEPIISFSNILAEAVSCGATAVVCENFDAKPYFSIFDDIESHLLRVPDGEAGMAEVLVEHWKNKTRLLTRNIDLHRAYSEYCDQNVRLFDCWR